MVVRVFNYNTLDKVHSFEAHTDYIRCLTVHPTQPIVLSCGDDMLIKMWDWDKKWQCVQVRPCWECGGVMFIPNCLSQANLASGPWPSGPHAVLPPLPPPAKSLVVCTQHRC
jgi:WD40 repeat protein